MDAESIRQMKVTELRSELQKLSLPTTGRKEELQARLLEAISKDMGEGSPMTGTKPPSAPITSSLTMVATGGGVALSTTTKSASPSASVPSTLTATTATFPTTTATTTATGAASKLSERTARFNLPTSEDDRKRQRMERFGAVEGVAASPETTSAPLPSFKRLDVSAEDREAVLAEERLRARQERFGIVSHSRLETIETAAQRTRRQERFNSEGAISTK